MSLADLYENAYEKYRFDNSLVETLETTKREARGHLDMILENHQKFFGHKDITELNCLEVGAGLGGLSLLLARLGAKVTALDVSSAAMETLDRLAKMEGVEIKTYVRDVSAPDCDLGTKFDLIIDSHLLHCIPLLPERVSYLQFVKNSLVPGGLFIGETMAYKKKVFIPDGYKLDNENVLWQKLGEWIAIRRIADSLDLEAEFQNTGFEIRSFYYYAHYNFAPTIDFWEIPAEILPSSVRFVLSPK